MRLLILPALSTNHGTMARRNVSVLAQHQGAIAKTDQQTILNTPAWTRFTRTGRPASCEEKITTPTLLIRLYDTLHQAPVSGM